jgi:aldose 1-epimerase
MGRFHLSSGSVSIAVDAAQGGRLSSLSIDGHELLVGEPSHGSMQWGSYPMVPWAGRIRDGLFTFRGTTYQMPCNIPPHALHGTGFTSSWEPVDQSTITHRLESPWPFGGTVRQHFELTEEALTITMTLTAEVDMPAMLGWHPWFARYLDADSGAGSTEPVEAQLLFGPAQMYELDDVAIPTGRLIAPPPGPWDNCFTSLEREPTIRWPGLIELQLESSCDHWVIYTEPDHALCVEPQTAAPDEFNAEPTVVEAGGVLEAWFRLAWR